MKIKNLTFIGLAFLSITALNAATVQFTNTNAAFDTILPVVDSSGVLVPSGSGSISVGYFTDEGAAATGDFASFVLFGSATTMNGAGFGLDGMYDFTTSQAILAGSQFIGQNIFTFITYNSEAIVAKSPTTFAADAPLFSALVNIANDPGMTYVFGGSAGPSVDIGSGPVSSVSLGVVPEPSSFALLAGCFGLAWVMVRRRA